MWRESSANFLEINIIDITMTIYKKKDDTTLEVTRETVEDLKISFLKNRKALILDEKEKIITQYDLELQKLDEAIEQAAFLGIKDDVIIQK